MSTRTVKLPLVNTDAGSRLIGYLASQQRLAYNHAVHVLNREPSIPKRATTGSSYGSRLDHHMLSNVEIC